MGPSRVEALDFTESTAAAPTKPQKETAINPGRRLMAVVEARAGTLRLSATFWGDYGCGTKLITVGAPVAAVIESIGMA